MSQLYTHIFPKRAASPSGELLFDFINLYLFFLLKEIDQ